MQQQDFDQLTETETKIVDDSFDRDSIPTRFRNIVLGTILIAALAVALHAFGASRLSITSTFVFFVTVVLLEKITALRTQMNSRSTIRKLVHRVEQLEGLPATPDNAEPSRIAQRYRRDHAA
jgi:ABC-type iron transport system FetAB ATPase subunit